MTWEDHLVVYGFCVLGVDQARPGGTDYSALALRDGDTVVATVTWCDGEIIDQKWEGNDMRKRTWYDEEMVRELRSCTPIYGLDARLVPTDLLEAAAKRIEMTRQDFSMFWRLTIERDKAMARLATAQKEIDELRSGAALRAMAADNRAWAERARNAESSLKVVQDMRGDAMDRAEKAEARAEKAERRLSRVLNRLRCESRVLYRQSAASAMLIERIEKNEDVESGNGGN